jgi:hypothetical protein
MTQIINFPTSQERFKMSMKKLMNQTANFFDAQTQASMVKDMMNYVDIWVDDDQFSVSYNLDQSEALSDAQLKAIKIAFEPHFEKMRLKAGYLLTELYALRMHKAKCEMLHGPEDVNDG